MSDESTPSLTPLSMRAASVQFDHTSGDWSLASADADGSEVRTFRTRITFDVPFGSTPVVHVGLTGFDIDNCDTARLKLDTAAISPDGFDVSISTWMNTRVYQVSISWLALGF